MGKKQKNWDVLQKQPSSRYRDVYGEQQLEHTKPKEKQTFTSRLVLTLIVSIALGFAAYAVCGLIVAFVDYFYEGVEVNVGSILFPRLWSFVVGFGVWFLVFALVYTRMKLDLNVQNKMLDSAELLQYGNDAHVQLPEEIQRNYDVVPDLGAHTKVHATALLSHWAVSPKGLKSVEVLERSQKQVLDEDGDVAIERGEFLTDANGTYKSKTEPIIDEAYMNELFDVSEMRDKRFRTFYDASKIPYNPGNKNRDKLSGYDTVADLINKEWTWEPYETQRPCGVYSVDSSPSNTLIVAMTRAGKGCMTPAA